MNDKPELEKGSPEWMRAHGYVYDPKSSRRPRWINRQTGMEMTRERDVSEDSWIALLIGGVEAAEEFAAEGHKIATNVAFTATKEGTSIAEIKRRLTWNPPTVGALDDTAYPLSGGKKKGR